MGLGWRLAKKTGAWVVLGDGECQEGRSGKRRLSRHATKLDNVTAILDFNGLQRYGWPGDTIEHRLPPWDNIKGMAKRWQAFSWNTCR